MKSFARKFLLVLFVTELVWAALLAFAPSSGQMRLFFVDEHGWFCDYRMPRGCADSERTYVPDETFRRDACYPPICYDFVKLFPHDRVRGGAPGRRSGTKAYDGFGSEGSFVLSGPLPENAFRQEWTLAMWMKNPRLSSKQACVLAGAAPDVKTGDFGWQVWLDAKGVPHVAMQDAKGRRHAAEGKPFRWEPNKWYLVLIAHLPDRDEFKQPSNRFRVWIVPETGAVPEALFDGLCGWGAAMESGIAQLQVGAAQPGKGKRSEIAPGGYFGGVIDEVSFFLGAAAVQADVETLRAGSSAR